MPSTAKSTNTSAANVLLQLLILICPIPLLLFPFAVVVVECRVEQQQQPLSKMGGKMSRKESWSSWTDDNDAKSRRASMMSIDEEDEDAYGYEGEQQQLPMRKQPDWKERMRNADGTVTVPIKVYHDYASYDKALLDFLAGSLFAIQANTCIRFVDIELDNSVLAASNNWRINFANGILQGETSCDVELESLPNSPWVNLTPGCMEQPFKFMQVMSQCLGIGQEASNRMQSEREMYEQLNRMFECLPRKNAPADAQRNAFRLESVQENANQQAVGLPLHKANWKRMKKLINEDGTISVPYQFHDENIDSNIAERVKAMLMEVQAQTCVRFVDTAMDNTILKASNDRRIWLADGASRNLTSCTLDANSLSQSPWIDLSPVCVEQPFRFLQLLSICLGIPPERIATEAYTDKDIFRWLNHIFDCNSEKEARAERHNQQKIVLEREKQLLGRALHVGKRRLRRLKNVGLNPHIWRKMQLGKQKFDALNKQLKHMEREEMQQSVSFTIYPTNAELRKKGIDPEKAKIEMSVRIWDIYRNFKKHKYIVPYYIHEMSVDERFQIKLALRDIEEHTCIQFRVFDPLSIVADRFLHKPTNPGADWFLKGHTYDDEGLSTQSTQYIQFRKGTDGCYSTVGREEFGVGNTKLYGGVPFYYQDIVLTDGCSMSKIDITHEMFHALGLFHFHSTGNRDQFLTVIEENLNEKWKTQFMKLNFFRLLPRHITPASIMVYSSNSICAIKKDVGTILTKDGRPFEKATKVPDTDWEVVNMLYNCNRDSNGEMAFTRNEMELAKLLERKERQARLNQLKRRLNSKPKMREEKAKNDKGKSSTNDDAIAIGQKRYTDLFPFPKMPMPPPAARGNKKMFKELVKQVMKEEKQMKNGKRLH